MSRRVLICGSRTWMDVDMIGDFIDTLPSDTVIIHGDARGADKIAHVEATSLGLACEQYVADWDKYGKGAGPIRNQRMLDVGRPDEVHAFNAGTTLTRGTADMCDRARKAGIPVTVHYEPPRVEAWV